MATGEFTGDPMEDQIAADQEEGVGWAGLHQDPLHLISQKLPDVSDLIRFRLVCKQWLRAIPKFDLSPRVPWIFQYRNGFGPELHFYSVYYNKIHTFDLGIQHYGTVCGIGLRAQDLNLSPDTPNQEKILEKFPDAPVLALNPSHIIIPPPPLTWFRNAKFYFDDFFDKKGEYWILQDNILNEAKSGRFDQSRDWIFRDESYNGNGCAYFKGRYFLDSQNEGTKIIDINNCAVLYTIPPTESTNSNRGFSCLIESKSGDLFKVFRPYDVNLSFEKTYFEIYRLVMNDNEQPFWVEIKNIKDEMFFLDYSPEGIALNARDFAGLKGNCIYFLKGEFTEIKEESLENEEQISENEKENEENEEENEENEEENEENEDENEENGENGDEILKELNFMLCKYDLMDGKIEKLNYPSKTWGTWVMPFVH